MLPHKKRRLANHAISRVITVVNWTSLRANLPHVRWNLHTGYEAVLARGHQNDTIFEEKARTYAVT